MSVRIDKRINRFVVIRERCLAGRWVVQFRVAHQTFNIEVCGNKKKAQWLSRMLRIALTNMLGILGASEYGITAKEERAMKRWATIRANKLTKIGNRMRKQMKANHSVPCLWRSDGERFLRNEDGTYSMDKYRNYRYSFGKLMESGVFSVYPPQTSEQK